MGRVPLLPAALAAAVGALGGSLVGALVLLVALALAGASVARDRRIAWTAAAVAAATQVLLRPLFLDPTAADPMLDPLAPFRGALRDATLRTLPEPEASLVVGILLGERAGIPAGLREAFRVTGTAHLLAISGHNMTLLAAAVAALGRGALGPVATAGLAVGAIAGYALLVGPQPSVARAALMASVAALGLALGRPSLGANALCAAAAAMLALAPSALTDVGFQLSVTATAGILLLHAPIAARFAALPRPLRDGLAVTFAATIPTLPLLASAFGRVSLVSPIANLVAVPIFAPLLVTGAVASVVGVLSPDAAFLFGGLALACARALRAVVELAAQVPLASIAVPEGPLGGALVAVVVGGLVALGARPPRIVTRRARIVAWPVRVVAHSMSRLTRSFGAVRIGVAPTPPSRRALLAGATAAAVIVAALVSLVGARPDVRIRALDVGQGDAFLIEGGGARVLVDGGPDAVRLLARLGEAMPPWDRRIDAVVLTHAHADHGVGLLAVLDRFDVGLAIEPRGLDGSPLAIAWRERASSAGVERRAVAAGARVRIGELVIAALAPNDDPRVDLANLVLRIEHDTFSALLLGDATDQQLADLLLAPERLRARVYVPPHHGAETAHAAGLVAAVRPEVALLSVGASNRYGHPTRATLAALGAVPTYRTDRDGTVEITTDGPRLAVRTASASDPPPRRGGSVPRAPPAR